MMKYRAVGFDWGGVINGQPGFVFDEKFCELVGVTNEAYKQAYFRHNRSYNAGQPITPEELWSRVLKDLGKPEMLEQVMEFVHEYRQKKSINSNVLDLVDKLRDKGYKTGLLSNNSLEAADKMREAGVDTHFDAFVVSAEVGVMKPDAAVFHLLCEKLGIKPDELVFVDDAEKSLSTASEIGYTPVLFTSYDNLIEQLRELHVL